MMPMSPEAGYRDRSKFLGAGGYLSVMSASERNAVVRAKSEPLDATPPLQPARNQESPAPLPPGVTWPPGETLPSEETVVADQLYEQPQDDGDEVIDLCDSDDADEEEEQVGEAGRLLPAIGELGNGCPGDDAEEEEDKKDKELAGKVCMHVP